MVEHSLPCTTNDSIITDIKHYKYRVDNTNNKIWIFTNTLTTIQNIIVAKLNTWKHRTSSRTPYGRWFIYINCYMNRVRNILSELLFRFVFLLFIAVEFRKRIFGTFAVIIIRWMRRGDVIHYFSYNFLLSLRLQISISIFNNNFDAI